MKKKEMKKDMPVKEGMQSEEPNKQSPMARPGVQDFSSPKELDGKQSESPSPNMKAKPKKPQLPKEGPFSPQFGEEAHKMYDPKKDKL